MSLTKSINSVYEEMSYFEEYSFDICITFLVIFIALIIIGYYNILSKIQNNKTSWEEIKCNPTYMPFAGIINSKDSDYTKQNFNNCLNENNNKIFAILLEPINMIFNNLFDMFNSLSSSSAALMSHNNSMMTALQLMLGSIIGIFSNMTNGLTTFFSEIMGIVGVLMSILTIVINEIEVLINMLFLSAPIFGASFLIGGVMPALSAFTLCVLIAVMFSCSFFLSWMAPPFWALSVILLAIFILLLAMYIIFNDGIIRFMDKIAGNTSTADATEDEDEEDETG